MVLVHASASRRQLRLVAFLIVLVLALSVALAGKSNSANANTVSVSPSLWQNPFEWPTGHGYVGWQHEIDTQDPAGYALDSPLANLAGLSIWLTGDREYRPGSVSWTYTAPGTTRVKTADLNLIYRNKLLAHHCMEFSLEEAKTTGEGAAPKVDNVEDCDPPKEAQGGPGGTHSYDVQLKDDKIAPSAKRVVFTVKMPICEEPKNHANDTACPKWIPSLDPVVNGWLARLASTQMVLVDDDLPVLGVSGPFVSIRGQYVDGTSDYDVHMAAADEGSGISAVKVELLDGGSFVSASAPCDPSHNTPSLGARICPDQFETDLTAPVSQLNEGRHGFLGSTTDLSGNQGFASLPEPKWEIFVDRTPPSPPTSIGAWYSAADPEEDEAASGQVVWASGEDPELADGSPGSEQVFDEYRMKRAGAEWTDWVSTTAQEIDVPNPTADELIDVEIRSVDGVLRRSSASFKRLRLDVVEEDDLIDDATLDEHIAAAASFRNEIGLPRTHTEIRALEITHPNNESIGEFGIPLTDEEFAEMEARGRVERRIAALNEYGFAEAPDDFAGIWVNQSAGPEIWVAFTSNAASHVETMRETFVNESRLRAVDSDYSLNELESLQERIDAEVSTINDLGIEFVSSSVRVDINRVEITVTDPSDLAKQKLVDRYGSMIVVLPGLPPITVDHDLGTGFHHDHARFKHRSRVSAGLALFSDGYCTSNASVFRGDQYFILTAGHCVQGGSSAWRIGSASNPRIGTSLTAHGWTEGSAADWGLIRTSKSRIDTRIWQRSSNGGAKPRRITGVQTRKKQEVAGMTVCLSGIRANRTRCGTLAPRLSSVKMSLPGVGAPLIKYLRSANLRSQGGDSGGPVFQRVGRNRALIAGILSGGEGYYSHVATAALASVGNFDVCWYGRSSC